MIRRPGFDHRHIRLRHFRRRLLLVAVFVPLLTGIASVPPTNGDELSDARARQRALAGQIAAQRRQVARLTVLQADVRGEIADATASLAAVNTDLRSVKRKISDLGGEITAVKASYEDLVAQLADLDRRLSAIRADEVEKAVALADRKALLAGRIRAAYDAQRTSVLETLLSAESFTDVVAEVGYLIDVGEQDKSLAEQIARDQETLAALRETITETRAATDELRVGTARQRTELAARIDELKAARDRLTQLEEETARELAAQRRAYDRLVKSKADVAKAITRDQEAQTALKREIDRLIRERYKSGSIPSEFNGTMAWPVAGRITQEFGCTGFPLEPTIGNCRGFHQGIDIAAPRWTPVRAAADGTVVFAGPNPYDPYPKAWIVIIAHAQNLRTWYAHVDDDRPPSVRAGQYVRKGEVIAYTGTTGRSTGYHTDWRVERNGRFVNPRRFL